MHPARPVSLFNKERRSIDRRQPGSSAAALLVGSRSIACVCENVSPGGAGVRLPADVLISQSLRLSVDGRVRKVQMVWRTGNQLGVRFLD